MQTPTKPEVAQRGRHFSSRDTAGVALRDRWMRVCKSVLLSVMFSSAIAQTTQPPLPPPAKPPLPKSAVDRARSVLGRLEAGKGGKAAIDLNEALPLFAGVAEEPEASAVEAALADVQPDALTPREALDLVYRLKGLLG